MKRILSRIMALCLMVCVFVQISAFAFADSVKSSTQTMAAEGEIIAITSEEDLLALAKQCKLDTWSSGKQVELQADITLTKAFEPIAIFSGTFNGNGHKISGLEVTGKYARAGLFGILTESAIVENLSLEGKIDPSGIVECAGAIAGENYGIIENCSFVGTVKATENAGGIAGKNELNGEIENCLTGGTIEGLKSAGGITAVNNGSISSCTNVASVNKDVTDRKAGIGQLPQVLSEGKTMTAKIKAALSFTKLYVAEDIGGIAGFSSGTISSCVNTGVVGCEGSGNHVGGVCGRTCGNLTDCSNSASVGGKKDVGGIAGLAEPTIERVSSGDLLGTARDSVDALVDILSAFTEDLDDCTDDLTDNIAALTDSIGKITDNLSTLEFQIQYLVNDKIDEVNVLKEDISRMLGENGVGGITEGLSVTTNYLINGGRWAIDAVQTINTGAVPVRDGTLLLDMSDNVYDADTVALESLNATQLADLNNFMWQATEDEQYADSTRTYSSADYGTVGSALLKNALADVNASLTGIQEIATSLNSLTNNLSADLSDYKLKIDEISPDLNVSFTNTMTAIKDTMKQIKTLTTSINSLQKVITSTLRSLTTQLRMTTNAVFDAIYVYAGKDGESSGFSLRRIYYSSTDYKNGAATGNGVIANCTNSGTIRGTENVGGIAGAQALERIPEILAGTEEDSSGIRLISFQYTDLVYACLNSGNIVGQGSNVGSITGSQNLGTISTSFGYGSAQSRTGSYVGGIAGYAHGVVDQCYAKAALSGNSYVGGIIGCGADAELLYGQSEVTDCVAQVEISGPEQLLGGISGAAFGKFEENRFISDTLNGIDTYSVAGCAESFDTATNGSALPASFEKHEMVAVNDLTQIAGSAPKKAMSQTVKTLMLIAVILLVLIALTISRNHISFRLLLKFNRMAKEEEKRRKLAVLSQETNGSAKT